MTVGLRSARFDQRVGGRHPTGKVLRHRTYGRLGSGRALSSPPDAPQPCPSPLSAPPASSPADWSRRSGAARPPVPSLRTVAVQFTAWNRGNGAVMAGTLAGITSLVDTGGALLIDLNLHAESVKSVLGRAPVKHRGTEAGFLVVRVGGRLTALFLLLPAGKGSGVRRRTAGGIRGAARRRVRPQPHRHADFAGGSEGGLPSPPGAHVAQHQPWPHHRLGGPDLPDRAPPVSQHAAPEPRVRPATGPGRLCRARRRLHRNQPAGVLPDNSRAISTRSCCAPATVPLPSDRALPGLTPWGVPAEPPKQMSPESGYRAHRRPLMASAMFGQPALGQRLAGTVGSDPVDAAHGPSILR